MPGTGAYTVASRCIGVTALWLRRIPWEAKEPAVRILTTRIEGETCAQFTLEVLGPYSSAVLMSWYYYDLFTKGEAYLSCPISGMRFGIPHGGVWMVVVFSESKFVPRIHVLPVKK